MTAIKPAELKIFVPFNSLSAEPFAQLLPHLGTREINSGETLFKEGDIDTQTYYLLNGRLELFDAQGQTKQTLTGGSAQTRYPLSQLKPRQHTATAQSKSTILEVDSGLLEKYLIWDQIIKSIQGNSAAGNEWMLRLLESKTLIRLPAGNIPLVFARLQEINVKPGQVIIRADDIGDYYYIIKEGQFRVWRQEGTQEKTLAELGFGDAFGEEALITDAPRNANVTALSKGVLMRLAKGDFRQLVEAPLTNLVNDKEAVELLKKGAGIIDVRLESEFDNIHIKGSQNIPLYALRQKALILDPGRAYLVVCDTGERSLTGAFLLKERGISAHVLKGGVRPMFRLIASQYLKA